MTKSDCIFCKLANGEIPTAGIYEDDCFKVILDMGPASRGHALILPKEHYGNIYELEDDIAARALVLAKKLAIRMKEKLKCDGINILQNNETAAGQTVFHFHIHLIPRYQDDQVGLSWNPGTLTAAEQEDLMRELVQ